MLPFLYPSLPMVCPRVLGCLHGCTLHYLWCALECWDACMAGPECLLNPAPVSLPPCCWVRQVGVHTPLPRGHIWITKFAPHPSTHLRTPFFILIHALSCCQMTPYSPALHTTPLHRPTPNQSTHMPIK